MIHRANQITRNTSQIPTETFYKIIVIFKRVKIIASQRKNVTVPDWRRYEKFNCDSELFAININGKIGNI